MTRTSGGNRLQRLKQLLARIEQLPPSDERDRILSEVRARAVDVDTGETPRAMLPVDPAVLPPIVLAKARLAAPRTSFVAPYKPRTVRPILPPTPPSAPPTERPMVELLSVDERLCLEETAAPDAHATRPWQRGLRG